MAKCPSCNQNPDHISPLLLINAHHVARNSAFIARDMEPTNVPVVGVVFLIVGIKKDVDLSDGHALIY
ncbi:hypothetical protein [Paenibacillus sp. Leaf72]|uniref:hypothetical protein n=1 Tax=Paenibacillus sp. Leaf72 TaxID=1736234 RepID=UPI000701D5F2|nr:hypothetical protein [Paenibacillus sp. Leaf72]KQO15425.1 hypothetical protein ASF12_28590 [Paenibacillus sp. Leaf72]